MNADNSIYLIYDENKKRLVPVKEQEPKRLFIINGKEYFCTEREAWNIIRAKAKAMEVH